MDPDDAQIRKAGNLVTETLNINGINAADGLSAMFAVICSQLLHAEFKPKDAEILFGHILKQYEESWEKTHK